ncbi:MAG TPA: hypothetical protein VH601_25540 [Bryobacteraceae bacterium]
MPYWPPSSLPRKPRWCASVQNSASHAIQILPGRRVRHGNLHVLFGPGNKVGPHYVDPVRRHVQERHGVHARVGKDVCRGIAARIEQQPDSALDAVLNHGLDGAVVQSRHRDPDASIECVEEHEVYSAIGEQAFHKLVATFYGQIPSDDILGPMYRGRDLAAAEQRLRGFLIYRFGGPQHYIEQRGHPRLRMRHVPFAITQVARDRWLQLMTSALDSSEMPSEPKEILRGFFESTATFLINRLAETTEP